MEAKWHSVTASLVLGLFGDRRAAGSRGLIENCHELGTLTRSLSALHLVGYDEQRWIARTWTRKKEPEFRAIRPGGPRRAASSRDRDDSWASTTV